MSTPAERKAIRQGERERQDAEHREHQESHPGYVTTEVVYVIEYRVLGNDPWYAADPFDLPRTGETEDLAEALAAKGGLVAGTVRRSYHSTPGDLDIAEARIIQRVTVGTILI